MIGRRSDRIRTSTNLLEVKTNMAHLEGRDSLRLWVPWDGNTCQCEETVQRALLPPREAWRRLQRRITMTTQHGAAVTALLAAAVVPVANADIINVPGDVPFIQPTFPI